MGFAVGVGVGFLVAVAFPCLVVVARRNWVAAVVLTVASVGAYAGYTVGEWFVAVVDTRGPETPPVFVKWLCRACAVGAAIGALYVLAWLTGLMCMMRVASGDGSRRSGRPCPSWQVGGRPQDDVVPWRPDARVRTTGGGRVYELRELTASTEEPPGLCHGEHGPCGALALGRRGSGEGSLRS